MSLLSKVPFPRSQKAFFQNLFSTTTGHDHDGTNSKAVEAVANNAVGTDTLVESAVTTEKIDDAAVTTAKIADGDVTVDKLQGLAALSAIALKSGSFAQGDGDDNELLAADGADDRAVLIMAYVSTTLVGDAAFSIHSGAAPGTEIVAVPTVADAGDYFVGGATLDSAAALNVSATAGDDGNIIVTVFALKDSE